MDNFNSLTIEHFQDFYSYISDYYDKVISDFMSKDYNKLLEKIVKLQDVVKMQNEVLTNVKKQYEKIKNIEAMIDEENILENTSKDSLK